MKPKAILVSGYFNPLHKGHIEYFHMAKAQGDLLFVIVNNDQQRALKGSKEFMLEEERVLLIKELTIVDRVILSIDQNRTVCATLERIHKEYFETYELFFVNGGDQNSSSSPETPLCKEIGIEIIDGLGTKIQSSSWLLKK
jgi:cytidyltransferase-like protein